MLKVIGKGLSIPEPSIGSSQVADSIATFEIGAELTGRLRDGGPRHDKDHENISDIEILPTRGEVESRHAEYLHTNDPRRLHLPGLEGLVDRHFRLLREDTVGQSRNAVRLQVQELRRLQNRQHQVPRDQKGSRVMIYRSLRFDKILPGRDYLSIAVSFQQSPGLATKTKNQRKIWWESSKGLQHDALVCMIGPSGVVSFMSVCSDIRRQADKKQDEGYSAGYFEDAHRATVFVRLIEPHEFSFRRAEACFNAQDKQHLVLCEFSGVLLPAFWHTLDALKMISRHGDIPFADLIAPTSTEQMDVGLNRAPEYAITPNCYFHLGSLIDEQDTLHLAVDRRSDYSLLQKHSTLDDKQQTALIDGLCRRLTLI